MGTLMLNTDTLLVGWLTPKVTAAYTLGLYAAAQRPVQVLYILPTILTAAIFPALSRFARDEGARFRSLLERSISFSFLMGLPIVAGGIAIAPHLMALL